MNESEMYQLFEGMEYQCITEDAKVKVYLSLSPKKEKTKVIEIFRRLVKRLGRKTIIIILSSISSILMGVKSYFFLNELIGRAQGIAVGGEIIFAAAVTYFAFLIMAWICEAVYKGVIWKRKSSKCR